MNLAALVLAPAGLAGLAAAWFLLDWMRASSAALPGLLRAGPGALPSLLLCAAAGSLISARVAARAASRTGRSPLLAAMRRLAAAAVAVIGASWGLEALLPAGGDGLPEGWSRSVLAVLPAAPAAFLLGGVLAQLALVRQASGARGAAARGGVLAVAAAGAGVGALLYPERLIEGDSLPLAAAAALLGAGLICALLSLFERPVVAGAAAVEPSGSLGGLRALLASALGAAAAPSLLRFALQARGDDLYTLSAMLAAGAAGVCLGAALASLPASARSRPLDAWLLLAPALVLLALGAVSPLLLAALLGLGIGGAAAVSGAADAAAASAPPERDDSRTASFVLACAAFGFALGLLGQDALRDAGWSAGAVLRAAAVAGCAASFVCALTGGGWLWRIVALLPGSLLALVAWSSPAPSFPWRTAPDEVALLKQLEDPRGLLTLVATSDGGTRRRLDGWALPSGPAGLRAEWRMARLSAAMQPDAQAALVIGAGDGQLLSGLSELLPGRVACIEPLGSLVEQARAAAPASATNATASVAPPALPEHADPRACVASRSAAWDLVVIRPQPPGRLEQGEELSLQHLLALRRAVKPGGVVVQWLPLQQMPWPAFAAASQAFLEAFPETRVFLAALDSPEPCVALVGGLEQGLPSVERLDALLGAAPSAAGLAGAADVFDLYLCDGWTLGGRVRDASPSRLEQPLAELLSARHEGDAAALSIINLRLLADLATPLDTVSLAARPVSEPEDKALGAELVARSRALRWLLVAQAARLERRQAAAGALSADERSALEDEQGAALLAAWSAAPGHSDVADAVLDFAAELLTARRWTPADSLLGAATSVLADGRLLGLRTGVLIDLGRVDDAVRVGRQALAAAPQDANALINLSRALLLTGQDEEARPVLVAAREAFAPTPLPPLHAVCLALIEQAPDARRRAEALLAQIPPGESWAAVLRRLLGR